MLVDRPDEDQQRKTEDKDPGRRQVPRDRSSDTEKDLHTATRKVPLPTRISAEC